MFQRAKRVAAVAPLEVGQPFKPFAHEEEVIECLRYLGEERGLRPGARHGPRGFAWFKSVVAGHFIEKRNREMVYAPPEVPWNERNRPGFSQPDFDAMTDAIEVDGS